MKLSSLTYTDKIKLAAELDGKYVDGITTDGDYYETIPQRGSPDEDIEVFRYATSYDAIIPLIQKQTANTKHFILENLMDLKGECDMCNIFNSTPSQLLDALLVATGKAEI